MLLEKWPLSLQPNCPLHILTMVLQIRSDASNKGRYNTTISNRSLKYNYIIGGIVHLKRFMQSIAKASFKKKHSYLPPTIG